MMVPSKGLNAFLILTHCYVRAVDWLFRIGCQGNYFGMYFFFHFFVLPLHCSSINKGHKAICVMVRFFCVSFSVFSVCILLVLWSVIVCPALISFTCVLLTCPALSILLCCSLLFSLLLFQDAFLSGPNSKTLDWAHLQTQTKWNQFKIIY